MASIVRRVRGRSVAERWISARQVLEANSSCSICILLRLNLVVKIYAVVKISQILIRATLCSASASASENDCRQRYKLCLYSCNQVYGFYIMNQCATVDCVHSFSALPWHCWLGDRIGHAAWKISNQQCAIIIIIIITELLWRLL